MLKPALKPPRVAQRGTSLLEVLVAMLLLSLAMLPLASLHARALQNTRTAQYRASAARLAQDWSERMRANRLAALAGAYDVQLSATDFADNRSVPACADPTHCTAAEIAARDLVEWRHAARASALPGVGMVSVSEASQAGVIDIRIDWTQPAMAGSAPDPQNVSVRVAL